MDAHDKILWLVSWYPNKYDAFDGDFIQRHARAAAVRQRIHVLFIKQHEHQIGVEEILTKNAQLTEQIIYLPKRKGQLDKIFNQINWFRAGTNAVRSIVQNENISMVHVHVPWKAGLLALYTKKKLRLPFVVTEHWGIYNQVVDDNIHKRSFIFRSLLKNIFKESEGVISVSRFLGGAIAQTLIDKPFTIIPNVVDEAVFKLSTSKQGRFTFLHVSNMVPLKNVNGLLEAFEEYCKTEKDAQLLLIGNRDDEYKKLADRMQFPAGAVQFLGEVPYDEVALHMRRSHVFVLNSNMENSPCVIGEALCCGLPVIATEVGGIPELIDGTNGILVPVQNNSALTKALHEVTLHYKKYHTERIASNARNRFSIESVSTNFYTLYQGFKRQV